MKIVKYFAFVWLLPAFTVFLMGCNDEKPDTTGETASNQPRLFESRPSEHTGIHFQNDIQESNSLSMINFNYLYIGGAVGVGDFNNDGLPDIYFLATQGENKLYLNKGQLRFEDITARAGVAAGEGIKMGVTVVDVNADGFLDMYVCRTGRGTENRENLLFINNKDLTFTEQAQAYGLADNSASNHANFFDYDLDGDLDMYLLNHPDDFSTVNALRVVEQGGKIVHKPAPELPIHSDKLYRNNGNHTFTDVSMQAGIYNGAFSLSCTVTDINNDGYPDIYIGNDYIEPDFLYINNKNGTFTNRIDDYFKHTTHFTMGADFTDINNDGLQDFLAMDMLPPTLQRNKQLATVMVPQRYNTLVQYGYGHQIMRNVLQLNNGKEFSDIGELAGIARTDWTWGATAMDFDNDGWKDIFLTNGILRDLTDNDYIHFTLDSVMQSGGQVEGDINAYIDKIPSHKVQNFMFRNRGDLTFEDVSIAWGFEQKTFSNGWVFADLDNDGDLDIIINNTLDPAGIFENKTETFHKNAYLQIDMQGSTANPFAVGGAVRITSANGDIQYQELTPTRGFLSSQQHLIHFGLAAQANVPMVEIRWPDGKMQTLQNVTANQRITVNYADAQPGKWKEKPMPVPIFNTLNTSILGLNFIHREDVFLDYDREFLIPYNISTQGPCMAVADVNGDGLDDLYVGGATGQAGTLYLQTAAGAFRAIGQEVWQTGAAFEETSCVFFDADGDDDMDLWIASGGNRHPSGAAPYQNRLYLNDGKGNFAPSPQVLPSIADNIGKVTAHDYDGDGDADIFLGGRVVSGGYPTAPASYVFQNNAGKFIDMTAIVAPELARLGMVTDIQFADLDADGTAEMLISGDWMPITVMKWADGQFKISTAAFGLDNTNGWWNTIVAKDMDGDGDVDIIAGNLGWNTRLKASAEYPLRIFAKDYDNNGAIDPVIATYENGQLHPLAQKDLLVKQIPEVKKKFLRYAAYSTATLEEVFSPSALQSALQYQANTFATTYFENDGKGKFRAKALPIVAQFAPVNCILADDFDGDGLPDLLLAGNHLGMEVETGPCDASYGLLLKGDGKGNFTPIPNRVSGFWAPQEVRALAQLRNKDKRPFVVVGNNNGPLQVFTY